MRRRTKILTVRRAALALIILSVHILQNTNGFFPEIFGARAFLLIPLVVSIGMFEREVAGAVFGLFAGALWDGVSGLGDGYNTLFLMLTGAVCGLLINVLMRNHLLTALILSAAANLIYASFYVLFFVTARGLDSSGYLFLTFYLPSAVYSFLFTPLFYVAVRAIMKRTAVTQEF